MRPLFQPLGPSARRGVESGGRTRLASALWLTSNGTYLCRANVPDLALILIDKAGLFLRAPQLANAGIRGFSDLTRQLEVQAGIQNLLDRN